MLAAHYTSTVILAVIYRRRGERQRRGVDSQLAEDALPAELCLRRCRSRASCNSLSARSRLS